jgi:hypothetical protein
MLLRAPYSVSAERRIGFIVELLWSSVPQDRLFQTWSARNRCEQQTRTLTVVNTLTSQFVPRVRTSFDVARETGVIREMKRAPEDVFGATKQADYVPVS